MLRDLSLPFVWLTCGLSSFFVFETASTDCQIQFYLSILLIRVGVSFPVFMWLGFPHRLLMVWSTTIDLPVEWLLLNVILVD